MDHNAEVLLLLSGLEGYADESASDFRAFCASAPALRMPRMDVDWKRRVRLTWGLGSPPGCCQYAFCGSGNVYFRFTRRRRQDGEMFWVDGFAPVGQARNILRLMGLRQLIYATAFGGG